MGDAKLLTFLYAWLDKGVTMWSDSDLFRRKIKFVRSQVFFAETFMLETWQIIGEVIYLTRVE